MFGNLSPEPREERGQEVPTAVSSAPLREGEAAVELWLRGGGVCKVKVTQKAGCVESRDFPGVLGSHGEGGRCSSGCWGGGRGRLRERLRGGGELGLGLKGVGAG